MKISNSKEKKIKLVKSFFKTKIQSQENLFESGKLDSLKVLDLISFIEKKTKKKISSSKLNQNSCQNLSNIIKIIK